MMLLVSLSSLVSIYLAQFSFISLKNNTVFLLREKLYETYLKMQITWFENLDYLPGVLTNILFQDLQ